MSGLNRSPREAVVRAWCDPGPVPEIHYAARERLARDWPSLARALHVLANTDERSARELADDLYDSVCVALESLDARNPAAAVDALRYAVRRYNADLATFGTVL